MISIPWKKKPLPKGLLYALIDKGILDKCGLDIFSTTEKIVSSGCDLVQLRAKGISDKEFIYLASQLQKIVKKKGKLFVVNDRADIACLSKADGLHLGNNDIPIDKARQLLGEQALIGITVHSWEDFQNISGEHCDYIGAGPVFRTELKPGLSPVKYDDLKRIIDNCKKLLFAIGGINLYNIDSLLNLGIKNIAVCRDLLLSAEIEKKVEKYKECLKKVS